MYTKSFRPSEQNSWIWGILTCVGGVVLAGHAWAQEQTSAQNPSLYLGKAATDNVIPLNALTGGQPALDAGVGQRTSLEPGMLSTSAPGQTTIITGTGSRKNIIVIQNLRGESGLTINGTVLTPEQRARKIAKQNLANGSTMGSNGIAPANLDTTIYVDSVIVNSGTSTSPTNQNKACVSIGTVGNSGGCSSTK
ncbi:MAG: hypothetical protein JKY92_04375 [Magnetovibrio sp.]|nr:hypothetical protein [Magnetovibrio sp.]